MRELKALLAVIAFAGLAGACAPRWYGHLGMEPMMWGGVAFGFLGTFLAVLLALFVYRWLTGAPGGASKSALDALKERYARGEIGKDEFERVKADLTK